MHPLEVALDTHRNYEATFDLDGTMSTVSPHPVYEVCEPRVAY
jgi:hypothetical protein